MDRDDEMGRENDAMTPDDLPPAGAPPEGEPDAAASDPDAREADTADLDPLERAERRIEELEARRKRQEADFLNETRRIRKQATEQGRYAIERVVVDLLPVLDALDSAAKGLTDSDEDGRVREGLALVERELLKALARHGVEPIEAADQPFDPGRHQAMMMVDDETRPPQTVSAVMRPGFLLHGRVVRPAEVLVVKGSARHAEDGDAADGDAEDGGAEDGGAADAGREDAGGEEA